MGKLSYIIPLILFCLVSAGLETHAAGDKIIFPSVSSNGTACRVIVKFKPEQVARLFAGKSKNDLGVVVSALGLPSGGYIEESMYTKWVRREHKKKGLADPGIDWTRLMHFYLPPGVTQAQCMEILKGHSLIEYVAVETCARGGAVYPNDQHFGEFQWYLAGPTGHIGRISAPEAWDITTGSSNIIVAILDTGLDTNNVS